MIKINIKEAGKKIKRGIRVYIKTFGCTYNISDSETMAGILKEKGYALVESLKESDLVIVNSCTVKNSAEAKFYTFLNKAKKAGKKVIAAGCIPQADSSRLNSIFDKISIIGVNQIKNAGFIAEETLKGKIIHQFIDEYEINNKNLNDENGSLSKNNAGLNLPKIRKNRIIEIIPINSGCLGNCSYCKTKQARGHLASFCPEDIIRQIKISADDGIKEVWLTSQDTGTYGKDIGTNLPLLLKEILKIKGNFKIRLGMCNPNFFIEFLDELINVLKDEKMFKFAHIPVQAGSSRILKAMNRKYSAEDYKKIISGLKKEIPEITIATDIICGFPTETETEFEETISLIKETKPDILNISRYWPRPETEASKMKQLHPNTIKARSGKLKIIFDEIGLENNRRWIGKECQVIIDEIGKDDKEGNMTVIGRNEYYKPIVIKENLKIGETKKVKIKNATVYDLRTF